ncbi:hypothetical protein PARHAE_02051 [Paracoccus haematequi]|uniref:Uncharacterized protein n=1 Tax=Paracoccus haematequi TaxID=2491866 RepID=A0A447IMY9_9RHOB|nr:hypothetical protein [Paracoccus haematequi]VDS08866.1 hypothetical protein PARHAE_02051 [Paracoccus haematequi]
MTDLPTIDHATVAPAAEGFAAKPLADTPEAHAAFQQATKEFAFSQTAWEVAMTNAGRFEAWDRVLFVPVG